MIKFCLFLFLCFCVFPMSGSSSLASNGSNSNGSPSQEQQPPQLKRKRQPGNPDPDAEVVALSPDTLVATNRFVCEVCHKGFQRDQNLQLHRRGHNLPWKLKQRSGNDVRKKVYVCPEDSCIHHDPARALSDLTGIKKHFCRKHGEKKWQCDKCPKKYAVLADLKAHFKICGTKEYKCVSCGAEFNRSDNYYSHRGGCDALAEETKEGSGVMVEDKGSRVQEKLPEVVSFMPVKGHLSQPAAILDFTYEEINDSLVQELMMGIPAKPLTMEEGPIFSSISSSFFGGPGREASLSSCFQLNASPPPIFEGSGVLPMTGCDPSMSATLLLQQVEQMGAKTGDGGWQPEQMIENTFLNTMAPHSFAIKQEPQGGESELTSSEVDEIAARFFRRHNGAELTPYMETMEMHTGPFYQTNSGSKSTVLDGATGNTFSAETAATPCGLWSLSGSDGLMTMDFLGLDGTMRERKHFRKQARALKKPI